MNTENLCSLFRSEIVSFVRHDGCSLYQDRHFSQHPELDAQAASIKKAVPDCLHFVWIGYPKHCDFNYINIWRLTNPKKKIKIWWDKTHAFCVTLHVYLKRYASSRGSENQAKCLLALQNDFFNRTLNEENKNIHFATSALNFLAEKEIINSEEYRALKNECDNDSQMRDLIGTEWCDINEIFTGFFSEYKRYYYYEVILRGNPACASDIVRLIILYLYGGIYIDVDTLPSLDSLFVQTDALLEAVQLTGNEALCLARSEAFLNHIENKDSENETIIRHLSAVTEMTVTLQDKIIAAIKRDLEGFTFKKIAPLPPIHVYPDFPALSSLPVLPGLYFNNIIAACKNGRSLRIILSTIKRKYGYLQKENALFSLPQETREAAPFLELLDYRKEGSQTGATLWLTGPGTLIEVLLKLAWILLKPQADITPYALSLFMQNDRYGIAFFNQTLDTPMGLCSCWRDIND